ncbi:MAG TPA: hypothetical protein VNU68_09790 [Verrucomicrobiae bacterium]|nr:hypothetical protein [Verrucomicrobiae bacterium]
MILIGISGKKGSGKDTACQIIRRLIGEDNVLRLAFADALKEEVSAACCISVRQIEEQKAVFRPILQWWGTEFRRGLFGDTYWIERLNERLEAARQCHQPVCIVTDVRFQNEAEAIRAAGGCLLRIHRPTAPTNDAHPSETVMDGYRFDDVIDNSGTISEFEGNICDWMGRFGKTLLVPGGVR